MISDLTEITELQSLVGASEELTEQVLNKVKELPRTPSILPIYNLLLLERYENALELIEEVMSNSLDLEYLDYLQKSKFYLQRKSVPRIIRNLSFPEKGRLLRNSLRDEICEVVKEAVLCIIYNNPLNNEELAEVAVEIYRNRFTAVKVLTVDLLILLNRNCFLLTDFLRSTNWRLRLKVASLYLKFNPEDQITIAQELRKDHVDEVRIELSKSLKSLDYLELLDDPSEFVRSHYLSNVITLLGDQFDLKKLLSDNSWEVKKVLLNLKGENFKKITIPLIRNSTENVSWRIKHEILCLVENNIDNEFTSKLLLSFLIKNLKDRVNEVRVKAQEIFCKIIKRYSWVDEFFFEIENLASNSNYLYRISAVPIIVDYDVKFQTKIGKILYNDPIRNVRERIRDYISEKGIDVNYGSEEIQ